MKDYPAVRRFQVVQESTSFVRIRMIVDATWNQETHARLTQIITQKFGPYVRVQLEQVDQIPLTATGKLQVVVNSFQYRLAG